MQIKNPAAPLKTSEGNPNVWLHKSNESGRKRSPLLQRRNCLPSIPGPETEVKISESGGETQLLSRHSWGQTEVKFTEPGGEIQLFSKHSVGQAEVEIPRIRRGRLGKTWECKQKILQLP